MHDAETFHLRNFSIQMFLCSRTFFIFDIFIYKYTIFESVTSQCLSVCPKKFCPNFFNVRILGKCRFLLLLLENPLLPSIKIHQGKVFRNDRQLHFHWRWIVLVLNY